jgi:hypothetical protein
MHGNKWLGIHLRSPQHFFLDIDINTYCNCVIESIRHHIDSHPGYGLFIASDMNLFIEHIRNSYPGRRVLSVPQKRTNGNDDWPDKGNSPSEETLYAVTDAMLLSQCDFILGGTSNLFLYALCNNPNLPFDMIPYLAGRDGQ